MSAIWAPLSSHGLSRIITLHPILWYFSIIFEKSSRHVEQEKTVDLNRAKQVLMSPSRSSSGSMSFILKTKMRDVTSAK
jgi:hypothetical protein